MASLSEKEKIITKETPRLWPPDVKSWRIWKDPGAGKDWGQEEKGKIEGEMVGWYHRLNGHGFGWTLGTGDGQGGLACCSSWGRKELDMTEWLNWTVLGTRASGVNECDVLVVLNIKSPYGWAFKICMSFFLFLLQFFIFFHLVSCHSLLLMMSLFPEPKTSVWVFELLRRPPFTSISKSRVKGLWE